PDRARPELRHRRQHRTHGGGSMASLAVDLRLSMPDVGGGPADDNSVAAWIGGKSGVQPNGSDVDRAGGGAGRNSGSGLRDEPFALDGRRSLVSPRSTAPFSSRLRYGRHDYRRRACLWDGKNPLLQSAANVEDRAGGDRYARCCRWQLAAGPDHLEDLLPGHRGS